jgi:predicted TPR repeat methyltransferase
VARSRRSDGQAPARGPGQAHDTEARQLARADALYEASDHAAADALYRQALEHDPDCLEALSGRAHTLAALSAEAAPASLDADAAARQAEELCLVAGECYVRGLWPEAIDCYRRALAFASDSAEALWGVADCHVSIGEDAEAIRWFHRYLEVEPDEPEALHMLAALGERPSPQRASDAYVAAHFDRFADSFDHQLVDELKYRVPELLLAAVAPVVGAARGALAILDLGCGTGLCGPLFRPFARRLDGVDLSPGMLRQARARGLYDRLTEAEIGGHLQATPRRYDVVLAADVLIYFGALAEIFGGIARVARPGGLLAFSAEAQPGANYRLMPSGRYAHARPYIRRVAAAAGWRALSLSREALRFEYAEPVSGDIWVFEKA